MEITIPALHTVAQLACDVCFVMQQIKPGFTFTAFVSGLCPELVVAGLEQFRRDFGISKYSQGVFAALRVASHLATTG
jgi:hypothetical protein